MISDITPQVIAPLLTEYIKHTHTHMPETEILQGIIDRVIYQNQENGFAVFVVQINATNA